jgi:hypothetical protein
MDSSHIHDRLLRRVIEVLRIFVQDDRLESKTRLCALEFTDIVDFEISTEFIIHVIEANFEF